MKNIYLLALCICFAFSTNSFSQRLMHGVGATVAIIAKKINTPAYKASFSMQQTMVTYFPRYNFLETSNSSFSIGAPLSAGIGIASNSRRDDVGISFAYDLPLALDYNFGCKANSETQSTFGGFVGAGFSYFNVGVSQSRESDFSGVSYGPIARMGIRFRSHKDNWDNKGIMVSFLYKKGMEKDPFTTYASNVIVDL